MIAFLCHVWYNSRLKKDQKVAVTLSEVKQKEVKMSARSIGFVTKQLAGRGRKDASAPSEWTAQMLADHSVDENEFCEMVASRTRQDVAEVKYMFSMASNVLLDYLRQGYHVNLSDIGFSLALTGKFPSADAAVDPSRNSVRMTVHAKPSFAKAVALSELNLVNVTHPLAAHIFSVMDATLRQDGVIGDPSRVLVTGEGLKVDQSAADEGVCLLDASGAVAATGTILENDAATLDCAFVSLPPAGTYRLEVRARNGAASSFAPAVVRKTVEVK